ncbi:MAG: hypothetical protein WC595_03790 [Candidatus Nanoarchaeia archaeon]
MSEEFEYLKQLVKERLAAMPPNVSFSIGDYGDFSRDELIKEVEKETEVGKAMIDMQVHFIRQMPKILSKV